MFGVLATFVAVGVFSSVMCVNNCKKQEYDNKEKNASVKWERAYNNFIKKTTNRSLERDLETCLRKIMCGSQDYPELVTEIQSTWKSWLTQEPFYIRYLGCEDAVSSTLYDDVLNVLLTILMANRGFVPTGCVVSGVRYNSICPSHQCVHLAKKLDLILRNKGVYEDLYVQQDFCVPEKLSAGSKMGNTGYIFWKPKAPYLYY